MAKTDEQRNAHRENTTLFKALRHAFVPVVQEREGLTFSVARRRINGRVNRLQEDQGFNRLQAIQRLIKAYEENP